MQTGSNWGVWTGKGEGGSRRRLLLRTVSAKEEHRGWLTDEDSREEKGEGIFEI